MVLFVASAGKLMLLEEAALRAGVASKLPLLARPTCMAIPAAMAHGMVTSAGCIGNRVYTRIGEDELYAAIPGRRAGAGGAGTRDHRVGQRWRWSSIIAGGSSSCRRRKGRLLTAALVGPLC